MSKEYFKTSDGNVFYTENAAENHARTLANRTIEKVGYAETTTPVKPTEPTELTATEETTETESTEETDEPTEEPVEPTVTVETPVVEKKSKSKK